MEIDVGTISGNYDDDCRDDLVGVSDDLERAAGSLRESPNETTRWRTRTSEPIISRRVDLQQQDHLGLSRQYWRDMILGVNDGLVSTFLLVAGVAGGGLGSREILLTAVSGALAGAVSMCAGEYVATKSQNQVMQGEISLEQTHVVTRRQEELAELTQLLSVIGISASDEPNLQLQLTDYYKQHPDALLKIMVALEFGVVDQEVRSPIRAGLFSCVLFIGGALPSVIPFACSGDEPLTGLIAAAICTAITLLAVGAVKSWATRGKCLIAAVENLTIAGFGGAFAYGVGVLFDMILKRDD